MCDRLRRGWGEKWRREGGGFVCDAQYPSKVVVVGLCLLSGVT